MSYRIMTPKGTPLGNAFTAIEDGLEWLRHMREAGRVKVALFADDGRAMTWMPGFPVAGGVDAEPVKLQRERLPVEEIKRAFASAKAKAR